MESNAEVRLPIAEYEAMKEKIKQLQEDFKKVTENPEVIILSYNTFKVSSRYEIITNIITKKDEGIHFLGKIIQENIKQNEALLKERSNLELQFKKAYNNLIRIKDHFKISDNDLKQKGIII